jgi:hypothetical protein
MLRLSEVEKVDFVTYIESKMQAFEIDKFAICNFDKQKLDLPDSRSTIKNVGQKTISIRKYGSSQSCTAMIGVYGSGYKFPPFAIFKGESCPAVEQILQGHRYHTTNDIWGFRLGSSSTKCMDGCIFLHKWIEDG